MATHHRLVERSSRVPSGPCFCQQCRRDLGRCDLRPRGAQPPDPVAAGPAGPPGGLRPGPRRHCRSLAHHRCAFFHPSPGFQPSGRIAAAERGGRPDGPGRELAADRRAAAALVGRAPDTDRPDAVAGNPSFNPVPGYQATVPTSPGAHQVCLDLVYDSGRTARLGCSEVIV